MAESTPIGGGRGFSVRRAGPDDVEGAQTVILRVLEEDLGGYNPTVQWDVADPHRAYVDNPRHALFVAVDDETGRAIGTTAVRPDGPKSPPHPAWLAERYEGPEVAPLFRVYIDRAHRRRGAAGALVEAARRYVATEGGYRLIYLHTNAAVPGAEAFWRAMPTRLVYDGRDNAEGWSEAVHFELALPDLGG